MHGTQMKEVVVTKIDAAIRQLNCAIGMYFEGGDPVPIHTLACAAHQIVHDINRAKGGPALLFDAAREPQGKKNELADFLRTHANYFKHADRDSCPNCGIRFSPRTTEVIVYSALLGLCFLKLKLSAIMAAYIVYMQGYSELLPSDVWQGFQIKAPFPAALRRVKDKEKFFARFLCAIDGAE
jgi:hypothetical protein